MALEKQTELEVFLEEMKNAGTSWTRNKFFDDNGYIILKKLCSPEKLFSDVPDKKGTMTYRGNKLSQYEYDKEEHQVEGSTARYWHPQYRQTHTKIRKIIEEVIGRRLYNTYYYDRFYFTGQELWRHLDRPPCEISVSVHVRTNLKQPWPIFIRKQNGENVSIELKSGDGLLYKGCERPHWREKMPEEPEIKNLYYHNIFFHYVLQDGIRAHHAFDRG